MKKYNFKKILSPLTKSAMAFAVMAGLSACDNAIYDFGEDCDPEPPVEKPDTQEPEPEIKPGFIRIYVRTNPGSGGTSNVQEVGNKTNAAETQEGLYVFIDVAENAPYTLTATESNPDYKFVRWHDDTNNGDLTEGELIISNVKADASAKYTAIFEKIEEEEKPAPGYFRIFVKTNPGSGGTSSVFETEDKDNSAETLEGIYVSIDVVENGTYTLSALESNPEYRFLRWHDDTNNSDLTEGLLEITNIKATASVKYTAVFEKIVEQEEPVIGRFRIFVKTNPGSGGTSSVFESNNQANRAETNEGIYVGIDVDENGTYTLSALESNPDYKFLRWHDDTNNSDLTEGLLEITNIKATASAKYTALFEKITEPEKPADEPEGYYVKYVFDKNMQFTDGFSQRVNSVDLYVFDTTGAFITKYHEDGVALKDTGYLMELTGLPAGEYEFVAWCGLTNNSGNFTVPSDAQISRNYQAACTMATSSDATHSAYQNKNLAPLFHGRKTDAKYVEKSNKKQIQTVYLTKNTNNINITLQHRAGLEFDKNRFTVTMHDVNDVMKHDNEIHADATTVQYRPYRVAIGSTKSRSTRADAGSTTGDFMLVELSTARLMENNNPIITVTDNETGKTVFSIPLVKWALQLRSSNYKGMDNQEYLDREDNYNLMLWLDSNKEDGWFGAEININNWHIVDDSSDIK